MYFLHVFHFTCSSMAYKSQCSRLSLPYLHFIFSYLNVHISGGVWKVYSGPDFQGQVASLKTGEYSLKQLMSVLGGANLVSSVQLAGLNMNKFSNQIACFNNFVKSFAL